MSARRVGDMDLGSGLEAAARVCCQFLNMMSAWGEGGALA